MHHQSVSPVSSLARVLEATSLAAAAPRAVTVATLSEGLGLSRRQCRYHAAAAVRMGLLVRSGRHLSATATGRRLSALRTERGRLSALARHLLAAPLFGPAIRASRAGRPATRRQVKAWVRRTGLSADLTWRLARRVDRCARQVAAF